MNINDLTPRCEIRVWSQIVEDKQPIIRAASSTLLGETLVGLRSILVVGFLYLATSLLALVIDMEQENQKMKPEDVSTAGMIFGFVILVVLFFIVVKVLFFLWGAISGAVSSEPTNESITITESLENDSSAEDFVTEHQNDTSPINNKAELEDTAYIVSKRYIESILKSPTTADFPFLDFKSTHFGDGRYRVTSYVDSQNSYGAMIRSDWSILMTYKGGEEFSPNSWELEEVIFDGKVVFSSPD